MPLGVEAGLKKSLGVEAGLKKKPGWVANEESELWVSREQQSWQPEPKFNSQCGPLPALEQIA